MSGERETKPLRPAEQVIHKSTGGGGDAQANTGQTKSSLTAQSEVTSESNKKPSGRHENPPVSTKMFAAVFKQWSFNQLQNSVDPFNTEDSYSELV